MLKSHSDDCSTHSRVRSKKDCISAAQKRANTHGEKRDESIKHRRLRFLFSKNSTLLRRKRKIRLCNKKKIVLFLWTLTDLKFSQSYRWCFACVQYRLLRNQLHIVERSSLRRARFFGTHRSFRPNMSESPTTVLRSLLFTLFSPLQPESFAPSSRLAIYRFFPAYTSMTTSTVPSTVRARRFARAPRVIKHVPCSFAWGFVQSLPREKLDRFIAGSEKARRR